MFAMLGGFKWMVLCFVLFGVMNVRWWFGELQSWRFLWLYTEGSSQFK